MGLVRAGSQSALVSCLRASLLRWNMNLDGRTWRRRFIAARLDDNPHLSGTGYREQLLQLPEQTQLALLGGRWDEAPIGGAIYGEVLAKAREEHRITSVPMIRLRVDTAWDLGVGDSTAIWFSQSVGREVRLIDYYEAAAKGYRITSMCWTRKGICTVGT